jgi:hypothetical protein
MAESMTKRIKGQITVFSALTIVLVLSLVCTCIRSAGVSAVRAHFESAAALSVESVFAGYSNQLLEEFDIFARKDTDNFSGLLTHYVKENVTDDLQFLSCEVTDKILMTDCGGECVASEIVSYMKQGGIAAALLKSEDLTKTKEQSEALKEITDAILECENSLCEMDTYILGIIQETEGISVDNTGIVVYHGKPVSTGEYFVKAVIHEEVSKASTGITDDRVYECAQKNDRYTNVCESIDNMLADIDGYKEALDSDDGEAVCRDYVMAYKNEYDLLDTVFSETKASVQSALNYVKEYNEKKSDADTKAEQCLKMLNQKKDKIDEELYTNLKEQIEELQNNSKSSLCDVDKVFYCLVKKEEQLLSCYDSLHGVGCEISAENISALSDGLDRLRGKFSEFSNDGLVFDYSGIDFSEKSEGLKKIKEIYKTISEGVTGLVIDSDKISEKTISIQNLAGSYINDDTLKKSGSSIISDVENELLYNEYLFEKFSSYTDYIGEDGSFNKDSEKQLDYMIEYILYGQSSDRENLSLAVSELALLREGINLAYLLTDSAKKQEAYALALTLVGYTGNLALVCAAKYMILTAWAYGESIVELRRLYRGEKVELIKTGAGWHLSLNGLLQLEFDDDGTGDKGLGYEEYLRTLLLMENSVKKSYRTMEAMELRMIELGNVSFRMKDYVYGMEVDFVYRIKLIDQYVEKHISYNYG